MVGKDDENASSKQEESRKHDAKFSHYASLPNEVARPRRGKVSWTGVLGMRDGK